MKKNIYLTILTIVTVACIIFGSLYHIIGFGSEIADYLSLPFFEEKESANNSMNTDTLTPEAFTCIKGDFSVIDLTICPGSSYKISYNGNKKFAPEYSVTDIKTSTDGSSYSQADVSMLFNESAFTEAANVVVEVS